MDKFMNLGPKYIFLTLFYLVLLFYIFYIQFIILFINNFFDKKFELISLKNKNSDIFFNYKTNIFIKIFFWQINYWNFYNDLMN